MILITVKLTDDMGDPDITLEAHRIVNSVAETDSVFILETVPTKFFMEGLLSKATEKCTQLKLVESLDEIIFYVPFTPEELIAHALGETKSLPFDDSEPDRGRALE